ncbi:hypothetical protein NDU88_006714 [Pleurodeles waltl]|uniref:Ig-like domain-containing protein n=1 Tax=Pleurodeles waltl TaxID=8319 RepID=A0AAV7LPX0_PLEWA|nr:hypothetical protein NDU88_006714 [Pleurodeles waltl]
MSWAPILLLLSFLSACSKAQLVVTQSPSASVLPGGTATVSCSISTGAIGDGHYPFWLQQRHEIIPKLLIYHTSKRTDGTAARFSGSRSGNTMSLTITETQAGDDANYYCGSWAQYSFTQGPSMTKATGDTVKLTRCLGGGFTAATNHVDYYQ